MHNNAMEDKLDKVENSVKMKKTMNKKKRMNRE